MSLPTYEFTLTGRTPLLMHSDDVLAADVLKEWRTENKKHTPAGDDRFPAWTYQTYAYYDPEGYVAMPSDNIMAAIRSAAVQVTMNGKKTFKAASQSGLVILQEFCEFAGQGGKRVAAGDLAKFKDQPFEKHVEAVHKLGFNLFVKRATIGMSKHVRVRPRFDEWSVKGSVQVLDDAITPEVLAKLFDLAGNCGLGDWRPTAPKKPGPYGTFTAKVKRV